MSIFRRVCPGPAASQNKSFSCQRVPIATMALFGPMRRLKNSDLYQAHVLCCITSDSANFAALYRVVNDPKVEPAPRDRAADTCCDVDSAVCRVPLIDSRGVA